MKIRKCLFYFILLSLLCSITTLSESAPGGTCEVGDIIQQGDAPDTGDDAPVSDAEPEQTQPFRKLSVSVVSPLTEATLDGSTVELVLYDAAFEQDISKIRVAVTVSGIKGVTIDTTTLQRISDQKITVKLDYDGTDLTTDTSLLFNVAAGAITNNKGNPLTAEILVTAKRDEALLMMYWTDDGTDKIQRANLDGSNIEDLVTQGLADPIGIALDMSSGKMYWTNWGKHKIQRANIDGSNIEHFGWGAVSSIALDVTGNKLYWTTRSTSSSIRHANLDGSNVEILITQGLDAPNGIALDVLGGKMYWTDGGADKIQRANLDGSNVENLVTGLSIPNGIALDVLGGKMYWTDCGTDKIQRANLDGSNIEALVTGLKEPNGIALDVLGGKMYWTDGDTDKIQRANLDGSHVEDLVTGLDNPSGIVIVMSSLVDPITEGPAIAK